MHPGAWLQAVAGRFCQTEGMPRAVKSGDEQDVLTRARRFYCWTRKAGACKRVKRRANRRERREGKQATRETAE